MRAFLISIIVILIIVITGGGIGYWQYTKAIQQPLSLDHEQVIEIPKGTSPNATFLRLEQEGIIKQAFFLKLFWRFQVKNRSFHTGEYLIKPGMTVQDLFVLWAKGDVVQYKVALIDGWNFKQVRAALTKQAALKQTIIQLSDEQVMAALEMPTLHPEGQFYPDTYLYIRGDTDLDILRRAHKQLVKVLDEEWKNKATDLPYETAYQALIMASIIERETGVSSERSQIAGVFVRRLQKNMLLQTDPTVIYGMGDRYNGKIKRSDLQAYTPYNTYVISGLPPTPIAMVSRQAIHAALHPLAGDALYFVAKGDGSHEFSASLIEHNKAVQKYQKKRRADYRSSPSLINEVVQ